MVDSFNAYQLGEGFHVGGTRQERVEVCVLSRTQAEDYWDGNWLDCDVRVAVGFFVGRFRANLRTDELQRFLAQLKTLYSELTGTASFETMEEQLRLSVNLGTTD